MPGQVNNDLALLIMQNKSSEIKERSVSAIKWGAIGSSSKIFLQFFVQIFLARILGPDQYGIFAIGVIVVSLSNFLSDIGIAYNLIQKETVSRCDIEFVFTWQVIIGIFISTFIYIFSENISGFFSESRSIGIIQSLSIVCFINALTAPSLNLLKRDIKFKELQIAQVASYVTGYVLIGIPLAIANENAYALTSAWIAQSISCLMIMYFYTRHSLRIKFWTESGSSILKYGLMVLVTNITNWTIQNIDRSFIGKYFSTISIGQYATAYNLIYTPTATLLGVIQPVIFTATSKMKGDTSSKNYIFISAVSIIFTIILPLYATIYTLSPYIIDVIYGSAWVAAGSILAPLSLAMPMYLLWGISTPVLWTSGKAKYEFIIQLPFIIITASVLYITSRISIEAVAWGAFLSSTIRAFLIGAKAASTIKIKAIDVLKVTHSGLFLTGLIIISQVIQPKSLNHMESLLYILIKLGFIMMLCVIHLFCYKHQLPEFVRPAYQMLLSKIPCKCKDVILKKLFL